MGASRNRLTLAALLRASPPLPCHYTTLSLSLSLSLSCSCLQNGFRAEGIKRPKLKEQLDAVKAKIAATGTGGEPPPSSQPSSSTHCVVGSLDPTMPAVVCRCVLCPSFSAVRSSLTPVFLGHYHRAPARALRVLDGALGRQADLRAC